NTRPAGRHPTTMFWYAGGVPRLMWELRDLLHLDALTVTGKTLGENLEELHDSGWFMQQARFLMNYALRPDDVIRPRERPLDPQGGLAVLRGNLAPDTAVVKRAAVAAEMKQFTGRVKVFDGQRSALDAIFAGQVTPGTAIVIRYEGPRGS